MRRHTIEIPAISDAELLLAAPLSRQLVEYITEERRLERARRGYFMQRVAIALRDWFRRTVEEVPPPATVAWFPAFGDDEPTRVAAIVTKEESLAYAA
jgi:hypothetical protein